ncbi:helix-turn-helix domain containing protein [Patescibacteria group bacterium]|nr:helix-turn-helix domain containing protein [Patescibacteria group bacterium]
MSDKHINKGILHSLLEKAIEEEASKEVIERLQWLMRYENHRSVSATCKHFNIARSTFYRWYDRFDPNDLSTLEDRPTNLITKRKLLTENNDHLITTGKERHSLPTFNMQRHLVTTLAVLFILNLGFLLFIVPTLASAASSWNPTLLVNTEAFQIIDDDDTNANVVLRFGDTIGEELKYVRAISRFDLTRDLRVSGNMTATGAISASGSITAEGAFSGASLHVSGETTMSGALSVEGTSSLQGAVTLGSTISINGVTYTFPPSDGVSSGWVLKTDAAGTLSWAAESGGSGLSQSEADDRYVNTSGDTMTGALLITPSGDEAHTPNTALEVHGTMSGQRLSVTPTVASETGAVFVDVDVNGTGMLLDSEATSAPGIAIDMNGKTNATPHILFGYNGTFDTNLYRSAANILRTDDSLHVLGALSGTSLHISSSSTMSGSLSVEGTSSLQGAVTLGSTISINGVTYTFPPSDGVSSGWVLKTDAAGTLSWAAESGGSGLSQSEADDRYVNVSGDTMTGALTINDETGADAGLDIVGTMSGTSLQVTGTGSAPIIYTDQTTGRVGIGNATPTTKLQVKGNSLTTEVIFSVIDSEDVNIFNIATDSNGNTEASLYDTGGTRNIALLGGDNLDSWIRNGQLAIGKTSVTAGYDLDVNGGALFGGNVGIGTTTPAAKLDVKGTMSGQALVVRDTVTLNGVTYTFPPSDGVSSGWVLKTDAAGTLSWAEASGGISQTEADDRYVNVSGDTMTGALTINNEGAEPSLNVVGTMSGTSLQVTGTGSSPILYTNQTTGRIGIGTTTPLAKLDVRSGAVGEIAKFYADDTSGWINIVEPTGNANRLSLGFGNDGYLFTGALTDSAAIRASHALHLGTNGNNIAMTIDTSQNVGIGTSSPSTALEVVGTISGSQLNANNMLTDGGIVYSDGTALQDTAAGSSGQLLTSQGTAEPEFKDFTSAMIWYIDGAVATGADQGATVVMPFGFTVTDVDIYAETAPVGSSLIIDINEAGSTIFSTNPEVDASANREDGNHVISDATLAAGALMTLDIDQVGSGTAGSDLTVILKGTRKY